MVQQGEIAENTGVAASSVRRIAPQKRHFSEEAEAAQPERWEEKGWGAVCGASGGKEWWALRQGQTHRGPRRLSGARGLGETGVGQTPPLQSWRWSSLGWGGGGRGGREGLGLCPQH